ncbi:MAG TPA: class I SAM-dependent methyltransferase, partial [Anaerolineaceae bacterium]|nr:class I SAM-dependent methyltransferase [Anaerolineaceae bacterium]
EQDRMNDELQIKQEVRSFYDRIGWHIENDGLYQNARYEDLRPVSQEYIHKCHLRVNRFITRQGNLLLDLGSGPVQYPEYLTYSENYQHRVCADISIVALIEARKRLGEQGLYVLLDAAHLPFSDNSFEGEVSLHTFHHLPIEDQKKAYREVYRVLKPGHSAAVVNAWPNPPLAKFTERLIRLFEKLARLRHLGHKKDTQVTKKDVPTTNPKPAIKEQQKSSNPTGTFIQRINPAWLRQQLPEITIEINTWRSVNVRFLRAVIHRRLGGRYWLRFLYWLEERFPHYFGEKGQYPLIVLRKPKI